MKSLLVSAVRLCNVFSHTALILLWCNVGTCDGGLQEKNTEARLTVLENEVQILKEQVSTLMEGDHGSSSVEQEEHSNLPLVLLNAERKRRPEGDDVYTVTLRASGVFPVLAEWWSSQDVVDECVKSELLEASAGGNILTTSAVGPPGTNTMVLVVGMESLWYTVMLRSGNESFVQSKIDIPVLEIEPEGDIAYEYLKDAVVNVKAPVESRGLGPGNRWDDSNFFITLHTVDVKSNTYDYVTKYSPKDVISVRETLDFMSQTNWTEFEVNLNTSLNKWAGMVDFTGGVNYKEGLLGRVQITKQVIIRPGVQSSPFIPGYLKFTDGQDEIHCMYGVGCHLSCNAVGLFVDELTLMKIDSNGNAYEVPFDAVLPGGDYFRYGVLRVEETSRDVDKEIYECRASASRYGMTIRRTIIVDYYMPAAIVKEESGWEKVEHSQIPPELSNDLDLYDDDIVVNVTCVATGDPLPNITFDAIFDYSPEYDLHPDSQFTTDEKVTAYKMLVSPRDTGFWGAGNGKGRLVAVSCLTSTEDHLVSDSYTMDFPRWANVLW